MAKSQVSKVQGNFSTIAKVAFATKATGSPYTKEFLSNIERTKNKIHSMMAKEKDFCIQLGWQFLRLEQLFLAQVKNDDVAKAKFNLYCSQEFKLQSTRVRDYISVASCKKVHHLKTNVSSLVELARLDDDVLTNVLKKIPKAKLESMTYRQMKVFVGRINSNSRKTLSPIQKKITEKKFREALSAIKKSFSMVRKTAKLSGLDSKQKKFIKDLAKWCESTLKKYGKAKSTTNKTNKATKKKVVAKKGGVK